MNEGYSFNDIYEEPVTAENSVQEHEEEDDILSGIEGRYDNKKPEQPRHKKNPKKKIETEEDLEKKGRGKRGIGGMITIAAMVAVIFTAEFFGARYAKENNLLMYKNNAKETPRYDAIGTQYSAVNTKAAVDTDLAAYYKFLLTGEHAAVTNDATEGVTFDFGAENGFKGYSSNGRNSMGTYQVTAENGKFVLTTDCDGTIDTYELSLSDSNDLVLDNGQNVFVLQ